MSYCFENFGFVEELVTGKIFVLKPYRFGDFLLVRVKIMHILMQRKSLIMKNQMCIMTF